MGSDLSLIIILWEAYFQSKANSPTQRVLLDCLLLTKDNTYPKHNKKTRVKDCCVGHATENSPVFCRSRCYQTPCGEWGTELPARCLHCS